MLVQTLSYQLASVEDEIPFIRLARDSGTIITYSDAQNKIAGENRRFETLKQKGCSLAMYWLMQKPTLDTSKTDICRQVFYNTAVH